MVAYQTAYLKVHYPVEYLSALLSSVSSDLDKIQLYIQTAQAMGIRVLPPDVNTSGLGFTPDYSGGKSHAIRFGLGSIKNVGEGVVESIISLRKDGAFVSLEDFIKRLALSDQKALNRKTLESLIQAGALDGFEFSRKHVFENVDTLIRFGEQARAQQETGQASLFDLLGSSECSQPLSALNLSGNPQDAYLPEETQALEKSLLGIYLTSHPLDDVHDTLALLSSHSVHELREQGKGLSDGAVVIVSGLISQFQRKITKTGRPMGVGQLEDLTGSMEFVIFSDVIAQLEQRGHVLEVGQKVRLVGSLQIRGDDGEQMSLIIKEVLPLTAMPPLELKFFDVPSYEEMAYVRAVLAESQGYTPVMITLPDQSRIRPNPRFWVSVEALSLIQRKLEGQLGGKAHLVA
ncbi:MAG: OB-fold nucleic acid binding domain-containing protein, partial [Vampirovibrionales bacterium]|nr:OB-fold nucleic acid binding domain-containing protein [Vampirovibrionales bacterium]